MTHLFYLFKDLYDRAISKHILSTIFGNLFHIEIRYDEIERECDDNTISFDYHYYVYMQGFPNNMDEIRNNFFNNYRTLKKQLKIN